MAIKQRIERLENAVGEQSSRYYLPVYVADGQTKEEAFQTALSEAGIRREDVGQVFYLGGDFGNKTEDFGGYGDGSNLIGRDEFWRRIIQVTATSWKSSIRKIIKKRREMESEGRLEAFYQEMPLMRPRTE